jgi:hypothetical protein
MAERTHLADGQSKGCSAIEHVFAHEKGLMGLLVRTTGLVVEAARAAGSSLVLRGPS